MPLFIFISGAVYYYCIYDLGKYKDKKKFIINKFKRLIIPYLFFGLFYVTPIMLYFKFTSDNLITYIVKGILLCGNSRHLWFLYYLFIYFTIYYYILRNTKKNKIQIILNILYFIIFCLKLPVISNIAFYALFFNLGTIYNIHYNKINTFMQNNTLLFLLIIIAYPFIIYYNDVTILNNIIGLISVLFIFTKIPIDNKLLQNKVYKSLKLNSMGIYLFHPMIIYVLFYYLGNYNINPYTLTGIIIITSFTLSYVMTVSIKRIKLNFILGDK